MLSPAAMGAYFSAKELEGYVETMANSWVPDYDWNELESARFFNYNIFDAFVGNVLTETCFNAN